MSYISRNDVENYLGVEAESALDSLLDDVILSAQDWVRSYCGNEIQERRDFDADGTVEKKTYDGTGKPELWIHDLQSLDTLTIDDQDATTSYDYDLYPLNQTPKTRIKLDQYDGVANQNSREIQLASPSNVFPKGQANIEVKGTFGYSTSVPSGVKTAVMRLAGAILRENTGDTDLRQVSSESMDDYSVSFTDIGDIANRIGVVKQLEPYKRDDAVESVTRKV